MNGSSDLLSITAFVSALCHAVLILGISFKLPDIADVQNTDNTLDVVLVNAVNNIAPEDAETVAAANNEGGGLDEQEASSPLPYKPVDASPIESIKLTADQETQTTLEPDQLITAPTAELSISAEQPDKTRLEVQEQQRGDDKISTAALRKLERERVLAKIQQQWEDYQKRPKKDYLSPSTRLNEAADYLDAWRKKVEQVGNANYPIQAIAGKISGTLILSVELNRNGTISTVEVIRPSPYKVLNDAAVRFVRDASPFAGFPDEIDPTTDILVITRAFHFLSNNRLTSTDASSQR